MAGKGSTGGHAFISYVHQDMARVDTLEKELTGAGVPVWRDRANLFPGQDWRREIRRAIDADALVFIACFSQHSTARVKSYQNEELTLAVEQLRLRPPGASWLIPVRLDQCDIPDWDIGAGRTLSTIQEVDLFGPHRRASTDRLILVTRQILGCP